MSMFPLKWPEQGRIKGPLDPRIPLGSYIHNKNITCEEQRALRKPGRLLLVILQVDLEKLATEGHFKINLTMVITVAIKHMS